MVDWLIANPATIVFIIIVFMGISIVFKISKKILKVVFIFGILYAAVVFLSGGF